MSIHNIPFLGEIRKLNFFWKKEDLSRAMSYRVAEYFVVRAQLFKAMDIVS